MLTGTSMTSLGHRVVRAIASVGEPEGRTEFQMQTGRDGTEFPSRPFART